MESYNMSVFFPEADILKILTGRKTATCRPYSLKLGQEYIFLSNFKGFARVRIIKVTFIPDITKINHDTVKKLGFKTRKEYLKQPYNVNNESKERYLIEFEVIENLILNYIDLWRK